MAMLSFRPLEAGDIECRVSMVTDNAVQLLLYKDARCDMRLLDETVGPENWQCRYDQIDDKLFCNVGLRFKDGEWVWKQDVGVPSNMESTKGEASDAFKRACFKWGIGRELYTAPTIWVDMGKCKKVRKGKNGKLQCYDDFRVTDISVNDGRIDRLTICNMSNRGAVVYGAAGSTQDKEPGRFSKLSALKEEAMSLGISEEGMKTWMQANILKGKPMKDISDQELKLCEKHVADLIASKKELMGDG